MSQLFSEFRLCLTISEMILDIGHKTAMFKYIVNVNLSAVYIFTDHVPNKLIHFFLLSHFQTEQSLSF